MGFNSALKGLSTFSKV